MIDVRSRLMRHPTLQQVKRQASKYVVIHWPGVKVAGRSDLANLQGYAKYHVEKHGWDGIAYTYAIGREGAEYQNRDWDVRLNHSGVKQFNEEAFSLLLLYGPGESFPDVMKRAAERRIAAIGIERRFVLGHQECPRLTDCPGALALRWLAEYRAVVKQPVEGVRTIYQANIRDESSVLSAIKGSAAPGVRFNGEWILGKPVKGDALWLKITGDRYIHASALDTSSYRPVS